MQAVIVEMSLTKETKNYFRFDSAPGAPITAVYIAKEAVGQVAPLSIVLEAKEGGS